MLPSVKPTTIHLCLHWGGHAQLMDPSRLPTIILYGELVSGMKPGGRPKCSYENQFKRNLAQTNIESFSYEQTASERGVWRTPIRNRSPRGEQKTTREEQTKKKLATGRTWSSSWPIMRLLCAALPPPPGSPKSYSAQTSAEKTG